jgi:hypothetical protein
MRRLFENTCTFEATGHEKVYPFHTSLFIHLQHHGDNPAGALLHGPAGQLEHWE